MKKYIVDYYETYSKSYEVEANSKEDLKKFGYDGVYGITPLTEE